MQKLNWYLSPVKSTNFSPGLLQNSRSRILDLTLDFEATKFVRFWWNLILSTNRTWNFVKWKNRDDIFSMWKVMSNIFLLNEALWYDWKFFRQGKSFFARWLFIMIEMIKSSIMRYISLSLNNNFIDFHQLQCKCIFIRGIKLWPTQKR